MNKYSGTKTEKNLWDAFAGESQARNKYTYFASVAKKAGYEQIAELFLKTADNEKEQQSSGSRSWASLELSRRTCSTPRRARTTSGPTCTSAWRLRPRIPPSAKR